MGRHSSSFTFVSPKCACADFAIYNVFVDVKAIKLNNMELLWQLDHIQVIDAHSGLVKNSTVPN